MTDQAAALAGVKTLWEAASDAVRRAIVSGKPADGVLPRGDRADAPLSTNGTGQPKRAMSDASPVGGRI
jgi:hypothetical protein